MILLFSFHLGQLISLLLEKHDGHFFTFGGFENESKIEKELFEIEGLGLDKRLFHVLSNMNDSYL